MMDAVGLQIEMFVRRCSALLMCVIVFCINESIFIILNSLTLVR